MFTELRCTSSESPLLILLSKDGILDVAIVINEQGTIQFFNRRAEAFFGYSKTEVVGR